MKITMINTRRTSPDGFTVLKLEAGNTYDIADMAATALIREGNAVMAETPKTVEEVLNEIIAENIRRRAA